MDDGAGTLWREGSLLLPCRGTRAKSPVHSEPRSPLTYKEAGHQLCRHSYSLLLILQKAAKSTEQFLCGEQWGSHVRTGPCGHPQDKA